MKNGHSVCCGCNAIEQARENFTTHGMRYTPEYQAYLGAKQRCANPNHIGFNHYGGRGIEFRFNSFEEFYAELGDKPSEDHSVDRIDVNGHYEVGNVRWAVDYIQTRNKTNNRWLTFQGRTECLEDWSRLTGINMRTIKGRLDVCNWCVECALTIKPNKKGKKIICQHKND